MDKKEFINYFKLLGVSYDASNDEITAKVVETVTALNDKRKVAYTEEERNNIDKQISLIAEANKCLQDPKERQKHMDDIKKYDKKLFIDDNIIAKVKKKNEQMIMSEDVEETSNEIVVNEQGSETENIEEQIPEVLDTDSTDIILSSREVTTSDGISNTEDDVVIIDATASEEETLDDDNITFDEKPKAAFSTRSKRKNNRPGEARVESIEDDEEAVEKSNKARNIIIGTTAVVLAGAIIIGALYYFTDLFGKKKKDDKSQNNGYSIVQEDNLKGTIELKEEDDEPAVTTFVTTSENEETPEVNKTATEERDENGITYRGDATDAEVVNKRVEMIIENFTKNEIINFNTMKPYTKAEIKDILLFINGAYVPSQEADVYSMVDNQMNFIAAIGSSVRNIDMVNYMANSDVINANIVSEDIKKYPNFDLVDSMLLGDSSAYPYLKWFNGKYNAMVSTTDKEESRKIFAEIAQSLSDVVLGDGYTIDGVTYTIRNFEGLGNINDGNVLMMLVNLFSIYNTRYVKHDYVVDNRVAGKFSLTIDQVCSQFDLVCSEDLIELREDDVIPDDIVKEQDNYHRRLQIDTIECALTNGQLQNQEYYKDQYTLSR